MVDKAFWFGTELYWGYLVMYLELFIYIYIIPLKSGKFRCWDFGKSQTTLKGLRNLLGCFFLLLLVQMNFAESLSKVIFSGFDNYILWEGCYQLIVKKLIKWKGIAGKSNKFIVSAAYKAYSRKLLVKYRNKQVPYRVYWSLEIFSVPVFQSSSSAIGWLTILIIIL